MDISHSLEIIFEKDLFETYIFGKMEFNDFLDIFERKYFGYFWNGNIISIFFFKKGDPLSILGRYFETSF